MEPRGVDPRPLECDSLSSLSQQATHVEKRRELLGSGDGALTYCDPVWEGVPAENAQSESRSDITPATPESRSHPQLSGAAAFLAR